MRSPVRINPHRVEGKQLIASVENHLGADCNQTGKLTWRKYLSNWKITMALDNLLLT
jgi:hypothetical protein